MRVRPLTKILLWVGIPALLFGSCVDDKYLSLPATIPDQSFVEEFDTVINAYNNGWRFINRSEPLGISSWTQGGQGFPAFSSKATSDGYVAIDYQATSAAVGIISAWIASPVIVMQNGDKIVFYTRTSLLGTGSAATDFVNRMQLCINVTNDGLNVGHGVDKGDFNQVLLDINPNYIENSPAIGDPAAYPNEWTRFEATVYGLSEPKRGRFAFRYFLEDGGSNGRGNLIAIDSVAYLGKK